MGPTEQILAKQIEWARNNGIELIGSEGKRGRKVYTTKLEANLFQPLNTQTKWDLEAGDGGELKGSEDKPAKIQALHSSSALGVNLFDYWCSSPDLSTITSSCRLSRGNRTLAGSIRFEQKFSVDDRFRFSPNIDVVIYLDKSKYRCFAIECKFTEAYSSRGHGGLDGKYFDNEENWLSLPATKRLGREISPDDNRFEFLHGAQLIKHILGLNRRFGHANYRLLYLRYDALGEPGSRHSQEVADFAGIVKADGIVFHETTYQDLILRLARHREQHGEYVRYLTERYL